MADLFDIAVARKLSGGGGGSWTVLTEESVTTTAGEFGNVGELSYGTFISSETIRVTFDGTEYECPRIGGDDNSAYGGIGQSGPDFSEYPFAIISVSTNRNTIYTETAGTYTVKLEEQQGGGSSDFSTAQVTIVDNTSYEHEHSFDNLINVSGGALENSVQIYGGNQGTKTAVLYQKYLKASIETSDTITATGDIEVEADSGWVDLYITGDGTITIS